MIMKDLYTSKQVCEITQTPMPVLKEYLRYGFIKPFIASVANANPHQFDLENIIMPL